MYVCVKRRKIKSDQEMKYLFSLFFIILVSCSANEKMNISKLGNQEFSTEAWLNSNQEDRGKMVNSFLQMYNVQEMNTQEIYDLLGDSTAYYEYDEFPAYFVGPKSVESVYGKGYVLAFPIDRKTGKIRKFVIEPHIE